MAEDIAFYRAARAPKAAAAPQAATQNFNGQAPIDYDSNHEYQRF
jgi:hypothetical protein